MSNLIVPDSANIGKCVLVGEGSSFHGRIVGHDSSCYIVTVHPNIANKRDHSTFHVTAAHSSCIVTYRPLCPYTLVRWVSPHSIVLLDEPQSIEK